MQNGTLFLLPVPLADEAGYKSFTPFYVETINALHTYIVENEKTARKFLKEAGLKTPQQDLKIIDYGKHNRNQALSVYFNDLKKGVDVGLMSEAGCPGVADPGAEIVAEAHRLGIRVVPLVGPNSMLQALMASGFSGQSYAFQGYLPIDKAERSRKIKELENWAMRYKQSQIFMETPFRNNQLLDEVLKVCRADTLLCIASHINGKEEFIKSRTIAEWGKNKPDLHKKPTVFLLYRSS